MGPAGNSCEGCAAYCSSSKASRAAAHERRTHTAHGALGQHTRQEMGREGIGWQLTAILAGRQGASGALDAAWPHGTPLAAGRASLPCQLGRW